MPLRMSVISSTGTRPAVSFTRSAVTAKIKAASSTQAIPDDHTALQANALLSEVDQKRVEQAVDTSTQQACWKCSTWKTTCVLAGE
jgi:hypothetical protein